MLDTVLAAKKMVPSPSQYKIRTTFEPPEHTKTFGNPVTSRSPRITDTEQIAITGKRQKRPGVGQYTLNFNRVEKRAQFGPVPKEDRVGYIEDAMYKAKNSPGFGDKNFKQVERKALAVKFSPPQKQKEKKKVNLSPNSYHVAEAFKQT